MDNDIFHSSLISFDNDEVAGDSGFLEEDTCLQDIIVYSRDWTVETVVNQIVKGNIDLNPEFQRRNAWNDVKKSSLVESYLIGYPVPEIVLAEHPKEKKRFIVIDGKQRLLALCGFLLHEKYQSWRKPNLKGLKDLKLLNNKSFEDLKNTPELSQYVRHLANADVRCTVISNVKDTNILYDIFYRLNAGATPLSIQELRQVLYSGDFTKFLINYTSKVSNIHAVLKLSKPDDRLKDVEISLRLLAMIKNISSYSGNLKKHLDDYTVFCNDNWDSEEGEVIETLEKVEGVIQLLSDKLGGVELIGRKWNPEKNTFESRFNTVIFEVQVYFAFYSNELETLDGELFVDKLKSLFENSDFIASISSSTKNIKEYSIRYSLYSQMFTEITGEEIKHPWMT